MDKITAQDLMNKHLLESKDTDNEMIELLTFMRDEGVPLTPMQVRGLFLLRENGITDIQPFIEEHRRKMTSRAFYKFVLKAVTMYDRIKGNAKLGQLLKANANPANGQGGVPMGIKDGVK